MTPGTTRMASSTSASVVVRPEAQAQRAARLLGRVAHRRQDVAHLGRPARAGRAGRGRDPLEVEGDGDRRRRRPGRRSPTRCAAAARRGGPSPRRRRSRSATRAADRAGPEPSAPASRARRHAARTPSPSPPRRPRSPCRRAGSAPGLRRAAGPGCASHAGSTAPRSPSGPRPCGRRRRPGRRRGPSTSRSSHGAACTASTWNSTPRRARTTSRDVGDRLDRAHLVVGQHHRDQDRAVRERPLDLGRIHASVAVDGHLHDLEAELLEVVEDVADGVVLDGGGDDPVAAGAAGPRGTLEREVVRLGAAAR